MLSESIKDFIIQIYHMTQKFLIYLAYQRDKGSMWSMWLWIEKDRNKSVNEAYLIEEGRLKINVCIA